MTPPIVRVAETLLLEIKRTIKLPNNFGCNDVAIEARLAAIEDLIEPLYDALRDEEVSLLDLRLMILGHP